MLIPRTQEQNMPSVGIEPAISKLLLDTPSNETTPMLVLTFSKLFLPIQIDLFLFKQNLQTNPYSNRIFTNKIACKNRPKDILIF